MWKSCVWASYKSKNTPQLMPMSGPFSSMWEKELKMSPLNEGYPLLHCFHFGIAKPDHDVSKSEAEGWWKRVPLSHRLGPVLFQIWSKHVFFCTKITWQSWKFLILRPCWGCPKKSSPRAPRGSWTIPKSPGPGDGVSSPYFTMEIKCHTSRDFTIKHGGIHHEEWVSTLVVDSWDLSRA